MRWPWESSEPAEPAPEKMAQALKRRAKQKLEATAPGNIFSKRRAFGEDYVDAAVGKR